MRLDRQQLPLVIPFIKCCRLIEALIALQTDQLGRVRRGQRLRHLGLADAGFALEQQRAPEQLHQRDRGRKIAGGDIAASRQRLRDLVAIFHYFSRGLMVRDARRRAPHHEGYLLPYPREAAGRGRGGGGYRGGGGGGRLSAGTAASVNAALPPTPAPSPPRAMRVEGGELMTSS